MWRNWLTRSTQNAMASRPCGFESHHAHTTFYLRFRYRSINYQRRILLYPTIVEYNNLFRYLTEFSCADVIEHYS